MKIAAVLCILSVYCIAGTEQTAYPRSWEELQHEIELENSFKMDVAELEAFSQQLQEEEEAEAEVSLEDIEKCAQLKCPESKYRLIKLYRLYITVIIIVNASSRM